MLKCLRLCAWAITSIVIAFTLVACAGSIEQSDTVPENIESADWPMFRFSLDRAGFNPTETVVRPPLELKWHFEARSKI